ncbi:lamin tail-like protein [Litoreibacter ponti]|uniref:Lamin tail-like protein n=1 Tax=Litoreibacter ponti TaxID=1510457 RepID=A0A2T6BMG2_9RHOB|nr:Hint domain-containing protein [Litoreibacter ponti]PTX57241.1 lamin tail-like protein [Litoreibacter ponti]
MADKLSSGVFIAEILADNAGSSAVDVDGDGQANKADEFIEIQNTSGNVIDLSTYQLWSEKEGLLHAFQSGDTLAPGATATVLGEYQGTPPAGSGLYEATDETGNQINTNSVNWLPDGEGQKFDSIFLVNTATGEYVVLSYGNPPRTPTLPDGFPGTNQSGAGESIDSSAPNGRAFARDENGVLVETDPTPGDPDVPCFVAGCLIDTPSGPRPVEELRPGDLVNSRDHGPVPVQAVARTVLDRRQLRRNPDLWPVRFAPGAIGNDRPLAVSAQHRMLLASELSEMLMGTREALAAARFFIGQPGVELAAPHGSVTYIHLLFARHEVIRAAGAWSESLFTGDLASRLMRQQASWAVRDGVSLQAIQHVETARPILRQFEAQVLLAPIPRAAAMG